MLVKELIQKLYEMDEDATVYLSPVIYRVEVTSVSSEEKDTPLWKEEKETIVVLG